MTATQRESIVCNLCFISTPLLDPLEERDWDMLQVSIQEILKAAAMVGVDVMSSPLSSLLGTAKELCSFLPVLVPNGVYLPSPPLYCPQPSPNTQVHNVEPMHSLCVLMLVDN